MKSGLKPGGGDSAGKSPACHQGTGAVAFVAMSLRDQYVPRSMIRSHSGARKSALLWGLKPIPTKALPSASLDRIHSSGGRVRQISTDTALTSPTSIKGRKRRAQDPGSLPGSGELILLSPSMRLLAPSLLPSKRPCSFARNCLIVYR